MTAEILNRAEAEISDRLLYDSGDAAHALAEGVSSGNLPRGGSEQVVAVAREGFFAGFNEILLIGGVLALAGAVAAVILVRPQDMLTEAAPAAAVA